MQISLKNLNSQINTVRDVRYMLENTFNQCYHDIRNKYFTKTNGIAAFSHYYSLCVNYFERKKFVSLNGRTKR